MENRTVAIYINLPSLSSINYTAVINFSDLMSIFKLNLLSSVKLFSNDHIT